MLEWTPAGVCILSWSWSRSQHFRFEPEPEAKSELRSVQEPIKNFKGPIKISVMMLVVIKHNGISWIETRVLTSVVIHHKSVTLGESTEHLTTYDGFRS